MKGFLIFVICWVSGYVFAQLQHDTNRKKIQEHDAPMNRSFHQAIFKITREGQFSSGTGFFITNFHVVNSLNLEDENFDDIELYQGEQLSSLKIKRIHAVSALYDLAILETENYSSTPFYLELSNLGITKSDEKEEDLFITGYTHGVFTELRKVGNVETLYPSMYQFAGSVSRFEDVNGMSGSPVVNSEGRVTGVFHSFLANIYTYSGVQVIEELLAENIGTNCTEFSSTEKCIEHELNSFQKNEANTSICTQYFGMQLLYHRRERAIIDKQITSSKNYINEFRAFFLNLTKYRIWLRRAAEQSCLLAQVRLAQSYYDAGNFLKAFDLFEKVAEQGYAPAQFIISTILYEGEGVDQNKEEAFDWLEQSAQQNFVPAQTRIAELFEEEGDLEQAFYWRKKLAEADDRVSSHLLSWYSVLEKEFKKIHKR